MRNLKKQETRSKTAKLPPKKLRSRTTQKTSKRTSSKTRKSGQTQFIAKMSHNLRTPLNAIIGFSEMIYKGKAGLINKEQKEYLNDILKSAKDLLHMVKKASSTTYSDSVKLFKEKNKMSSKTNKRRS